LTEPRELMADSPVPYQSQEPNSGVDIWIEEFGQHINQYSTENYCVGVNGLGEKLDFVPKTALEDYWTREKVGRMIRASSGPDNIPHDLGLIVNDYIVIFSILVLMRKPLLIELFMKAWIKDQQLPISSNQVPKAWSDLPYNRELWHKFWIEQWKFCPLTFGRKTAMWKVSLNECQILPIQKERLPDKESGDGDIATLYKVEINHTCRDSLSVSIPLIIYSLLSTDQFVFERDSLYLKNIKGMTLNQRRYSITKSLYTLR
jgi:hypothetical protein